MLQFTQINEFWSYVFAWKIEGSNKLTKQELTNDLIKYYNGLMSAVNRTSKDMSNITTVNLTENTNDHITHKGMISTFDAFVDLVMSK